MKLVYNILPIYYLLLEVTSKRNARFPAHGGHFHHSDLAMHHDDNYNQGYDSIYSSEELVMRAPRRSKYTRDFEYSDSEYKYKCQCSCTKCKKRKPKPKPCCKEFCETSCNVQSNIVVVPYPVPFMVFNNHSMPEMTFPLPPPIPETPVTAPPAETAPPPPTTTTTPPPMTTRSTSLLTTPPPRRTLAFSSTNSYFDRFDKNAYKRFRIMNEQNLRRNLGNNGFRSPKFGRLPKYGIVPIPENLALSLMHQLKRDQINDPFRNRFTFDKNQIEYAGLPIA